jgi:riboflavin kinase/FMN adenylyltransferase
VNLDPHNQLYPGNGVYITSCRFATFARTFLSVTNIGVRPTLFENYAVTIESHVLDFASNVYEDEIRVFFHQLIRREKQFQSAIELTNQIRNDIETTRLYFLRHPPDSI